MALVSKLSNKYKTADSDRWIKGDKNLLDPIFLGRLAQVAASNNVVFSITSGFRSWAEQNNIYKQYLNYLKTGKGTIKMAAKPGTSRHEFHLAADISTQPIRRMSNSQLLKYGLHKPIKSEPWHIEPIETKSQSNLNKLKPQEVDDMTKDEVLAIVKEYLDGNNTKTSEWAKPSWDEMTKKGVTDGNRPGGYAKREEIITIIARALKLK